MRAHNLSYDTWLPKEVGEEWTRTRPQDVTKTPCGAYFVLPHIRHGILARILDELYDARKGAKRRMADAGKRGDEQAKTVFNGRQLALKVNHRYSTTLHTTH